MKQSVTMVSVTVGILLGLTATAWAGNDLIALPTDVNDGAPAVGNFVDAAPGYESGSWAANGVSYSKLYIPPSALFDRAVTVGELASITYYTKKGTTHTVDVADWFFQMYTEPYTGSPGSSWYGNRINSEPYFSESLNDPANTWNQWVTDPGQDNRLRFYDSSSGYFGSYTDGFLQDLTADPAYSAQPIMLFAVGTGTAWAAGFTGQIDGLAITLTDNDVATVNFEAIPEPGSAGLMALGAAVLLWRRKPRPSAVQ